MTPRGAWKKVTTDLAKIAKRGDLTDLRDYLASDVYAEMSAMVVPARRLALVQCAAKALTRCYNRTVPVITGRASWDAAKVAQLKAACARHRCDFYRVGRDLGVSAKAAQAAHKHFVVGGAEPRPRKPSRKAQDGRSTAGLGKVAASAHGHQRLDQAA